MYSPPFAQHTSYQRLATRSWIAFCCSTLSADFHATLYSYSVDAAATTERELRLTRL